MKDKRLEIEIGEMVLSVFFKDKKWWESLKKKGTDFEIFISRDDDMETEYLSNSLSAYKLFSLRENNIQIDFAGRILTFSFSEEFKRFSVDFQIGDEYEDGSYDIDIESINKDKWLDIADFFEKCSLMFINDIAEEMGFDV